MAADNSGPFCPDVDEAFHDVPGMAKTFVQGGASVEEPVLVDVAMATSNGTHAAYLSEGKTCG